MLAADPKPTSVAADPISAPLVTPPESTPLTTSPAAKVLVVLPVPEFVYLTKRVRASLPVAAAVPTTLAVTPLVAPVITMS